MNHSFTKLDEWGEAQCCRCGLRSASDDGSTCIRPTTDYTFITLDEMADDAAAMWTELKRRNPIGVNTYQGVFTGLVLDLLAIASAEKDNPTTEDGPERVH